MKKIVRFLNHPIVNFVVGVFVWSVGGLLLVTLGDDYSPASALVGILGFVGVDICSTGFYLLRKSLCKNSAK